MCLTEEVDDMRRAFASNVALLLAIGASSLFLNASPVLVPSGTWAPTGELTEIRAGAAAVLLSDGVVLITGGVGPEGRSASAERYSAASGTFIATASMSTARANHSATVLNDGRVLVVGGRDADGMAIAGAEIYDPAANMWAPAGTLVHARAGHTATMLPDGRVLVAGGENGGGALASMEVYSPVYEEFLLVAAPMTAARTKHAAAVAGDKVLIIGGWDGAAALASVDVYDPATDSVAAGPEMLIARAEHTATTLLSGNVLVAGGMNTQTQGELQTAEVFDAAAGVFVATANEMSTPRRNHTAMLLPHNNSVLIAGGWSDGAKVAAAELYRAWQDGGIFVSTGSSTSPRNWSAGGALSFAASATNRSGAADGLVLVAGGDGTSSAELYGFATLKTDKDDYSPGMTVRVSGSGWQPNQPVTFYLRELPAEHYARLFTIDADNTGNIAWTDLFLVEEHHLGVHFLMTAGDGVSQAHMAFTDSNPQTIAVAAPTSVTVVQGGTGVYGNVTVTVGGNNNPCTVTLGTTALPTGAVAVFGNSPSTTTGANIVSTLSVTTTASTPAGTYTFQVTGTNSAACQGPGATPSNTITLIVSSATVNTTTTASNATATYGDSSITLNAQVDPPASGGTVVFTIKNGGTTIGTASGTVAAGVANASFPLSGVNANTYTIEAAYSGGTGFNASDNAGQTPFPTLIVGKAATTTVVTCGVGPFTYNGAAQTPCSANVTGAGGLNQPLTVSYSDNTNAGTATASATYAESANHFGSSDSKPFAIGKAATTTVVTCGAGPFTYNGAPHMPCTASVTGAGGLNESLTVSYSDNINAGTATASATYAESANHLGSTDSVTFAIGKAATTAVVTCPAGPFTYDGTAQTPCSANVTGAGGLNQPLTTNYSDNINAGTATASASYGESANHLGSTDSEIFTIGKAATTTLVSCPAGPFTYNAAPHTPCSATVTGAGGLNQGLTVSYSDNINAGVASASASYTESANYQGSADSETFTIGKATTTTVVTCGAGPFTYNGAEHTPCSADVTGEGGLSESLTVSYSNNINAGPATASATYAESANYQGSTDSETFNIDKAATTTVVTCPAGPFTYNALAHTPCSANVTGPVGLSEPLTVSYLNNISAGTATASATYDESANYQGSTDSEIFTIDKAATTTLVTCPAGPFTYTGAPHTPCSANVTGAGALNQSLTVSYLDNINAGTATANAAYVESANYLGSTDSETFTIGKAITTTLVTCGAGPFTYTGAEQTPCSANVTGAGALSESLTVSYSTNTNAGTATANAAYVESANYLGSTDSETFTIGKAHATVTVNGYSGTYDGAAHSATGSVVGVDAGGAALGTTLNLGTSYTSVPGGTAAWTFVGGINYTDQNGTVQIAINKATPIVTVSFGPSPITFDGNPHPATVTVMGVSGPLAIPGNGTTPITYTRNAAPFAGIPTLIGNYTSAASFTSTNGNYTNASSTTNALLTIVTACSTFNGFLSPIGGAVEKSTGGNLLDPVRSFKLNSTIPVKFAATCSGAPLLTGAHTLKATKYSNAGTPDAPIDATPTDAATTGNQFRLSGVEWHFNLSTKALGSGAQGIWLLEATLFDGSAYTVWVEIKK